MSPMSDAASCSPSASPMAVSAHPGPLSGPVERSIALHWSWNILLACSEPRNLVRQAMCTWSEHRRPARPHHAEFYRILPSETVAGYHNGKYMIGAVLQVTWVTSWPSFCWKSLSRPSFYNFGFDTATNEQRHGQRRRSMRRETQPDLPRFYPKPPRPL